MQKITADMLHNPRAFKMIALKSGDLEGEARTRFIEKVSEHNLYLAAKCKLASYEPEQELVDYLTQKAIAQLEQIDNPKVAAEGMLALAEIDEEKLIEMMIDLEFDKLQQIYQAIEDLNIKPPLSLSTLLAFKASSPEYDYQLKEK